MIKRLHILQDQKIINRTISFFEEVFPKENKYIVLLDENKQDGVYVKNNPLSAIYCIHYNDKAFWEIIGELGLYETIIVHYLFNDAIKFINSISHPNIYWIEWGGDLYNCLLARKGFKLYRDKKLVYKLCHPNIPYFLSNLIYKYKNEKLFKQIDNAIKKIRYILPDSTPDEYPLLLKYYPEYTFLKHKDFFYYPIQEILGDLINEQAKGNSIVIGNSCSFTNNHPYVFDLLKDICHERDIIVPLSYSGNTRYKEFLINKGRKYWGDLFIPILDYMPLKEYNKLLLKANTFIFGNLRQEAVGNMVIAMFIGARIFIDSYNPMYEYYKSLGLHINKLEEITEYLHKPLTEVQIADNRNILSHMYSNERLKDLIFSNF